MPVLCAALTAKRAHRFCCWSGRPAGMARQNSQHTRNPRCMYDAPQDVLVESYPKRNLAGYLWHHRRQHQRELAAGHSHLFAMPRLMRKHGVNFNRHYLGRSTLRAHQCVLWAAESARQCLRTPNGWRTDSLAITRRFTRLNHDGEFRGSAGR